MPELTTLGRSRVEQALGNKVKVDTPWVKDVADAYLKHLIQTDPEHYREITQDLLDLGREAVYTTGTTLSMDDLKPVIDIRPYYQEAVAKQRLINQDPNLTPAQKKQQVQQLLVATQKKVVDATYEEALRRGNPLAEQVRAKARGNKNQLTAILSTPGVYTDARGDITPMFIQNSFSHGLTPREYWASTPGARSSVISTKFATRDAGYLGKQINSAIAPIQVVEEECGATQGIGLPVKASDTDNLGAVLAQDIGDYKHGTVITPEILSSLESLKGDDDILVRSPVTCRSTQGVCAHCAGHREQGRFPKVGERIGTASGAALADRIAQSSLNTKHSGGMGGQKGDATFQGFPYVDQFMQVPSSFNDAATLAKQHGTVDEITEAPQGGHYIRIGDEQHFVPADLELRARVGDKVYAGDALSGGLVNPKEVVQYKGLGEGRRYFTSRLMQMLNDSGYAASRRNVEVITRGLINHVVNNDMEDIGGALPGDVLDYNGWASGYSPRKDSQVSDPERAIGKYLEAPALHYSIGTEITPEIAKQLKRFDQHRVMVHDKPTGVTPHMLSLREVPQHQPDWMAQLGSNYLKKNLMQNVHRGAVSNTLGRHPLPRVAAGTIADPRIKDYHTSPNLMDTHRKVRYDTENQGADDHDEQTKLPATTARRPETGTDGTRDGPDDGGFAGFFTRRS